MKKIICLLFINFLISLATQVWAEELLVVSGETSKNSQRWKEEVLPEYARSEVGKKLSAKIVAVRGKAFPEWLATAMQEDRIGEIIGTPTFIIWDEGNKREVGRVEGYTQKAKFYSQLSEALTMVENGQQPGRREGSGGHAREEEGSGGDRRQEGSGGDHRQGEPEMSRDIMDHMYKTPDEAKRASEKLGFKGEIHTHESPEGTIYMPGPMM